MNAPTDATNLPLEGIRVIELGDYLSVTMAGSMLADFGAEVIKVDLPGKIGNSRILGGRDERDPTRSPHFSTLSRNKRSITLDVRQPAGVELLMRLVEVSDVMVENFRPGTLEKWGIGPQECEGRNPGLVILRLSGFGQTGEYRSRASLDNIAQSFGGLVYLTGYPDMPPVRAGLTLADCGSAILGAYGVVLSLLARERSPKHRGTGQVVDVALYDIFLPMLGAQLVQYGLDGAVRERMGNKWVGITPGGAYQSRDGKWLNIDATGDQVFCNLATAIGHPKWCTDERLSTRGDRWEQREELETAVGDWVASRDADEVVEALVAAGVPVGIVNSIADMVSDPHVQSRGDFVQMHDDVYGELLAPAPLPRLSRSPGTVRSQAPKPGQDNNYVFGEILGMSEDEQATRRAERVI